MYKAYNYLVILTKSLTNGDRLSLVCAAISAPCISAGGLSLAPHLENA